MEEHDFELNKATETKENRRIRRAGFQAACAIYFSKDPIKMQTILGFGWWGRFWPKSRLSNISHERIFKQVFP